MRTVTVLALLAGAAPSLVAQEGQDLKRPDHWKVRLDRASMSEADIEQFVAMPPGWHITTGRAAGVFYDPGMTASGSYTVSSKIFLFDPGQRHREAYGIFFGGQNLEGAGQRYSYFVIRDTGEFLIKQRRGDATETLTDWTASDAIVRFTGEGPVANLLEVKCGSEMVEFFINGKNVTSLPTSRLGTDGIVGLRVNHGVNLHVATLEVKQGRM